VMGMPQEPEGTYADMTRGEFHNGGRVSHVGAKHNQEKEEAGGPGVD